MHRAPTVALALALLCACTVGPDFHVPSVAAPGVWGTVRTDVPGQTTPGEVQADWWQAFNDPTLTSLVQRLFTSNIDLQTAAERILQGRAQRRVTASEALPLLNGESSYRRIRVSKTGIPSLFTPAPGAPLEYNDFHNALSASWDLDLFGRIRRAVEAADADTLASIENRRAIALAALADLAQDYLQLRGVQARRTIAERNLVLTEQGVKLVRDRFANGVATTLDLAQAQAQRATIAATLAPLRTQEARLINAIGFLLAAPPRALVSELASRGPLPAVPALVPVGVPGTLIRRRPDVQEAEARLHAATARTGVAVASFYPDISLTGIGDFDTLHIAQMFSLPSRAFELGPTLTIPIFRGGQLTGELRLRESQQREAALTFQRTVLQSWQEVDDALTAYAEAQARRREVAEAAKQNEAALAAARQRYQEGVADFLNVVTSQAQLLQSQDDLALTDTEIAADLVALYRALGGGWEVAEAR